MKLHELHESAEERSVLSVIGQQQEKHDGNLYVNNMRLTSLEGCSDIVQWNFACDSNELTSLVGGPNMTGLNYICENNQIDSFEGFPSYVHGDLCCSKNNFKSLKGIHLEVSRIRGCADFSLNPIKSHVLGLMLIDDLKNVYLPNKEVQKIINKYLKGSRDVFDCQNELMDAGFDEYAQL